MRDSDKQAINDTQPREDQDRHSAVAKRLPSYVRWIGADRVEVEARTNDMANRLREMGFSMVGQGKRRGLMEKRISGEGEMVELLRALLTIGLPFSGGKDWCPIAVAEDLRDRGLLQGPLAMIGWSGPGNWEVRDV